MAVDYKKLGKAIGVSQAQITKQTLEIVRREMSENVSALRDAFAELNRESVDLAHQDAVQLSDHVGQAVADVEESLTEKLEKQSTASSTALADGLSQIKEFAAGAIVDADANLRIDIAGINCDLVDGIYEEIGAREAKLVLEIQELTEKIQEQEVIKAQLENRIAEIKDGEDGEDGQDGEKGEKGDKGEDGLDRPIVEPVAIEAEKFYPKNTLGTWAGGLWVTNKDALGTPELDPHAWTCVLDSLTTMSIDLQPDRTFKLSVRMATGKLIEDTFEIPFIQHKGIWEEGAYCEGDIVTKGSSFWLAIEDTEKAPPGNGWQQILTAPKGRRGEKGEQGEQGIPGRNGMDAKLPPNFAEDLIAIANKAFADGRSEAYEITSFRGVFSPSETYAVGDVVNAFGALYLCIKAGRYENLILSGGAFVQMIGRGSGGGGGGGGGIDQWSAIATPTTGTIEGDVNAMDWTGHEHAEGTALSILPKDFVIFGNDSAVAYIWIGPKNITVGVGGNYVSTDADYQPVGTSDHAVLINRDADDSHPQSAITDLLADQAVQDQNLIDHETDTSNPHAVSHAQTTGQTPDDHHAQAHAHDGTDGSGTVAHGDLTGIGTDDHHNQVHKLFGTDHSDVDILSAPTTNDGLYFTEGPDTWGLDRRTKALGNFVEGTAYQRGDELFNGADLSECVTDGTRSRPFVTPTGAPGYLFAGTIDPTPTLAKVIIFGQRYTSDQAYYVTGLRVYGELGQEYLVYMIQNPGLPNSVSTLIETFIANENGWRNFNFNPTAIPSGVTIDFVAVTTEPAPTPVTEVYPYNYTTAQNIVIPLSGQVTQGRGDASVLRVSYFDNNAADRSGFLQGLTSGDSISIESIEWVVTSVTDVPGDFYVEYKVLPSATGTEGLQDFTFETVAATPIVVGEDLNYWDSSGTPLVRGLKAVDNTYDSITPDANAYGLDLLLQNAYVPDPSEWRLKVISGSGGSGVGGGGGDSPLNTKGDLYTFDTDNQRLPVGTDTQRLRADPLASTGLRWEDHLLDNVVDVNAPAPVEGQRLAWDGAEWIPVTSTSVLGITSFPYDWNTGGIGIASGDVSTNNIGDPVNVTEVYVSTFDNSGADRTLFLEALVAGNWMNMYLATDTSVYEQYDLIGPGVENAGVWTFPVVYFGHQGVLNNNAKIELFLRYTQQTPVLTTKGDLLTHNGVEEVRLPISAGNGWLLTADNTAPEGISWQKHAIPPASNVSVNQRWSTDTTAPPGDGFVKANNTTTLATELYVSKWNEELTVDISEWFEELQVGDYVGVWERTGNDESAYWLVAGAPTDMGDYVLIPISLYAEDAGIAIPDGVSINTLILTDPKERIPTGGSTGQVLSKSSANDYETEWVDQTGGGGSGKFQIFPGKGPTDPVLIIGFGDSNSTGYVDVTGPNFNTNNRLFDLVNPSQPANSGNATDWVLTVDPANFNFATPDPTAPEYTAAAGLNQVGYQQGNRGQITYQMAELIQQWEDRDIYIVSVNCGGQTTFSYQPGQVLNTLINDLLTRAYALVPALATLGGPDLSVVTLGSNDARFLGGITPQVYANRMNDIIYNSTFSNNGVNRWLLAEGTQEWNWAVDGLNTDPTTWSGWQVLNAQTDEHVHLLSSVQVEDNRAQVTDDWIHYSGYGRNQYGRNMFSALIQDTPYKGDSLPRHGANVDLYDYWDMSGVVNLTTRNAELPVADDFDGTARIDLNGTLTFAPPDTVIHRHYRDQTIYEQTAFNNASQLHPFVCEPIVTNQAGNDVGTLMSITASTFGARWEVKDFALNAAASVGLTITCTVDAASTGSLTLPNWDGARSYHTFRNADSITVNVGYANYNGLVGNETTSIGTDVGYYVSSKKQGNVNFNFLTSPGGLGGALFGVNIPAGVTGNWNMYQNDTYNNRWGGGHQVSILEITGGATVLDGSHHFIFASAGANTVTLPDSTLFPGQEYYFSCFGGATITLSTGGTLVPAGNVNMSGNQKQHVVGDPNQNRWIVFGYDPS